MPERPTPGELPDVLTTHASQAFYAVSSHEQHRGILFQKNVLLAKARLQAINEPGYDMPLSPRATHGLELVQHGAELQTAALIPLSTPELWARGISVEAIRLGLIGVNAYFAIRNGLEMPELLAERVVAESPFSTGTLDVPFVGEVNVPTVDLENRERNIAISNENLYEGALETVVFTGLTAASWHYGTKARELAFAGARPWRQLRRAQGWNQVRRGWSIYESDTNSTRNDLAKWYKEEGYEITEANLKRGKKTP